ncbi:hypothetical protein ACFPYI_18370 [Halomarina salina]|uniref:Uncharacterized protein n=1 Tax=Halomarina salina TaxID=1872699 RepID=A0ABD5RT24_9EURY|nr:hypothetical protein [Halomarina salina]
MNSRTAATLLVALCLLLAGCLSPAVADESTPTPDGVATPDDRFDLRVANDADREVSVVVWFVTGSLDDVVVTSADGTNATYSVADLRGAPVAVENATSVTPRGDVDRSVGLRLSAGVDGVAQADVSGVESVVYAVSAGGDQVDDGEAVRAGVNETVQYVGVGSCSAGGVVTGLTLNVDGASATAQVTCDG